MRIIPIIIILSSYLIQSSLSRPASDATKLKDIKTLTLYYGRMTTGRRNIPIPQLRCVGGSAGCYAFIPQVVQCKNKGSDGVEIQWECKTDMDNAFRFGKINVQCEGYDNPTDPYVLKGSCSLAYTIDLTKEGIHNQYHNYYGNNNGYYGRPLNPDALRILLLAIGIPVCILVVVGIAICCCCATCETASSSHHYSSSDGFRTGATVGYLFGNRSSSGSGYFSSGSSRPFSSGTRTASGFGGTTIR